MMGDWFRSPEWGDAAEGQFRERLARARSANRAQYRRVKAIALLETADPEKVVAGRRLLLEILEAPESDRLETVMALSLLGRQALREDRLDEAEANLREAVHIAGPSGNGTTGLEVVWLAQIALQRGDPPRMRAAVAELADLPADRLPLTVDARFDLCLTAAQLAAALDDRGAAAVWARAALELSAAEHSGLRNHPTLGLVALSEETRSWLVGAADGFGPSTPEDRSDNT